MGLSIQVPDEDIYEIIQIDGTGDTSSNDEIGSTRDVDEHEVLEIIDAGDLKVLEGEADNISNGDSTTNSSDNEDPQIDIVEEVSITFELKLSLFNLQHLYFHILWNQEE